MHARVTLGEGAGMVHEVAALGHLEDVAERVDVGEGPVAALASEVQVLGLHGRGGHDADAVGRKERLAEDGERAEDVLSGHDAKGCADLHPAVEGFRGAVVAVLADPVEGGGDEGGPVAEVGVLSAGDDAAGLVGEGVECILCAMPAHDDVEHLVRARAERQDMRERSDAVDEAVPPGRVGRGRRRCGGRHPHERRRCAP